VRFPGVIPAVTTPFDPEGAVDADALTRNTRALLDAGMGGFVGCGTMGEAGSMTPAERKLVLETLVAAVGGRVPVTAGISAESPRAALGYAADAADAGVDALMLLPPLLYRGDAGEIEAFYRAVAAETDLPIMAYNNPAASGTDMPVELISRLAEIDNLVAIKECSGDARRIAELVYETSDRLEVLVGGDDWALEGFCAGATGWISGVANPAPELCRALFDHCMAGELEPAREIYRRILPLARFDMTPKLVQYFKAAMDEVGLAGGACRPPRLELAQGERDELVEAMHVLGGRTVAA
jgi:4-hydroxy-tetrahydrodipicolinate synthase